MLSSLGSLFLYLLLLIIVTFFPDLSPSWGGINKGEYITRVFLVQNLCNLFFRSVQNMMLHGEKIAQMMGSCHRVAELLDTMEEEERRERDYRLFVKEFSPV